MRTVFAPNAEDFEDQCRTVDCETAALARRVAALLFARGLLPSVTWFSLANNYEGIPQVRFNPVDGILAQMALAAVAANMRDDCRSNRQKLSTR